MVCFTKSASCGPKIDSSFPPSMSICLGASMGKKAMHWWQCNEAPGYSDVLSAGPMPNLEPSSLSASRSFYPHHHYCYTRCQNNQNHDRITTSPCHKTSSNLQTKTLTNLSITLTSSHIFSSTYAHPPIHCLRGSYQLGVVSVRLTVFTQSNARARSGSRSRWPHRGGAWRFSGKISGSGWQIIRWDHHQWLNMVEYG